MEKLLIIAKESAPVWSLVSASFILAYAISFTAIPTIVRVARLKNLTALPNKRTSHSDAVPNLGGIALFTGFLISTIIVAGSYFSTDIFYVISCLVILFFIGMKDDILVIDPKKKLAAQILVAMIIAILADLKIDSLFEMFNISNISYFESVALTVLLILVIINGFNLIDGIDGLASGIGILTSTVFGFLFWELQNTSYTIICFSLAGALSGFFQHNVFGKQNKIFLGDTGSLILGLLMSIIMVELLQPDKFAASEGFIHSTPALAIGILIVPIFDIIRIFTIRISQGKSPFIADKQHIHHLLLKLGFSHLHSTLILLGVNVFFILLCFSLQNIGNLPLILTVFSLATAMSYFLQKLVARRVAQEYSREVDFAEVRNYEAAVNFDFVTKSEVDLAKVDMPEPEFVVINYEIPEPKVAKVEMPEPEFEVEKIVMPEPEPVGAEVEIR